MQDSIMIRLVALLISIIYVSSIRESITESYHSSYRTAGNPNILLEDDCALRAFTIEMAGYIAPATWKTNWKNLSENALQMNQCQNISNTNKQHSEHVKPFKAAPDIKERTCYRRIFVHDLNGDDMFAGTFEQPMKTIQGALSRTRTLRTLHGSDKTLCMTIRGGTYYLGTNVTAASSEIGAIALTSNDSNFVIENYQNERVVLSGGTLLKLQWSIHAKTAAGSTIMKAEVPSFVNLQQFNELYIDDRRAIVAKYPNGDPSTQGLYAINPGFSYDSESWIPPIVNPSLDIYVDNPSRNGTMFHYFQLGIGGGASVFNPPSSFWSTAAPPHGKNYGVPRGFVVKNGALPHISNWSKPTTGFVHAFHGASWGSWVNPSP